MSRSETHDIEDEEKMLSSGHRHHHRRHRSRSDSEEEEEEQPKKEDDQGSIFWRLLGRGTAIGAVMTVPEKKHAARVALKVAVVVVPVLLVAYLLLKLAA
ncbi:hypothetical protein JCM6882_003232 [Rhodosporidiobolus microsporus]